VLVDVDSSMDCMTEETFGPTLPIVKVKDIEEALGYANDSEYGLNSSVFTRDTRKGEAVARRLEAGASCVNAVMMNYAEMRVPFGGWKLSGVGGRHGGIRKYCKQQTIMVTPPAIAKRDLMRFPRSKRMLKGMDRVMTLLYGRGG
jgi:acyl-CoA reductase-like NAD-dependent aldehyde dehydrogenase